MHLFHGALLPCCRLRHRQHTKLPHERNIVGIDSAADGLATFDFDDIARLPVRLLVSCGNSRESALVSARQQGSGNNVVAAGEDLLDLDV